MRKYPLLGAAAALSVLSHVSFGAAITTINVVIAKQLFDENTPALALPSGVTGVSGDGAILQLGYFDQGTASNLFAGQWVPLTGGGSFNPQFNTTVGDGINSGAPNRASFQLSLDTTTQRLPAVGTPLGIRIFNQTLATALDAGNSRGWFSQTVVSPDWLWQNPAEPPTNPSISIAFTNANARLLSSGALLSSVTTVATITPIANPVVVPEPSSLLLLSIGALISMKRRRS